MQKHHLRKEKSVDTWCARRVEKNLLGYVIFAGSHFPFAKIILAGSQLNFFSIQGRNLLGYPLFGFWFGWNQ
jgi:hypothetical protein